MADEKISALTAGTSLDGVDIPGEDGVSTKRYASTLFTPASATDSISAAGSTQGTATALTARYNRVTTATAGQGVKLLSAAAGLEQIVFNDTSVEIEVYPNTSDTINGAAVNVSKALSPGAWCMCIAADATDWFLHSDFEAGTFNPEIEFGGATTGWTWTEQTGYWNRYGNIFEWDARVTVNVKGSATGNAYLVGFPSGYAPDTGGVAGGGYGTYYYSFNNSLNGFLHGTTFGGSHCQIRHHNNGYGGTGLTHADFVSGTNVNMIGRWRLPE